MLSANRFSSSSDFALAVDETVSSRSFGKKVVEMAFQKQEQVVLSAKLHGECGKTDAFLRGGCFPLSRFALLPLSCLSL